MTAFANAEIFRQKRLPVPCFTNASVAAASSSWSLSIAAMTSASPFSFLGYKLCPIFVIVHSSLPCSDAPMFCHIIFSRSEREISTRKAAVHLETSAIIYHINGVN